MAAAVATDASSTVAGEGHVDHAAAIEALNASISETEALLPNASTAYRPLLRKRLFELYDQQAQHTRLLVIPSTPRVASTTPFAGEPSGEKGGSLSARYRMMKCCHCVGRPSADSCFSM